MSKSIWVQNNQTPPLHGVDAVPCSVCKSGGAPLSERLPRCRRREPGRRARWLSGFGCRGCRAPPRAVLNISFTSHQVTRPVSRISASRHASQPQWSHQHFTALEARTWTEWIWKVKLDEWFQSSKYEYLDNILKVYFYFITLLLLMIHGLFRFHCVSELCISVTSSARTRGQELITPHTRQPASGH